MAVPSRSRRGFCRRSFVPPKPIRQLRNFTRYRKAQIKERQREANRLHKALEDTGIKLDCVASDILGVSGRAMLDALCAGTTDPEVLAELAKGRLRAKLPALREALEGRFDAQHALLIGAILAHLDFLDEQIERLSDAIEEQLRPFQPAVELLAYARTGSRLGPRRTSSPRSAPTCRCSPPPVIAPHGRGSARVTISRPASAAPVAPARAPNGSNDALKDAAMAAIRTNDSYLQAQYQRLRPRIGHGRALGAVKHSIICAIWHMLSTGELYRDLGGDYFRKRDPERQTKRLIAELERLGHKVTLEALQQAA